MTIADPSHPQGPITAFAKSDAGMVMTRGMVVAAPIILAAVLAGMGWFATHYLDGAFQHETDQIAAVASRVSEIDNAAQVSADKTVKVADDLATTKQTVADDQAQASQFRSDTKVSLDKHSDALTAIATTLGEVSGKIDTDIQYWHRQGTP